MNPSIAIIGGGAAGMMAAAAALENNPEAEIFLIEKNASLGQKVIISGGGRCNVTTGFSDMRLIADRYPRGGKFLQSAFHRFPPEAVMAWFESHGVPLKTEEDLRVFPVSNNGKDIVAVFEKMFQSPQVHLLFRTELKDLEKEGEQFRLTLTNHEPLEVDKVVLTTGGQAYRHTGSTGDGYHFAEHFGHKITALAPSLNSFIIKETWPRALSGVALGRVHFTVKCERKFEVAGPMLFTHRGLTGPAVFALSSEIAFESYTPEKPLELLIDLIPNTPFAIFEEELKKEMQANPKKTFRNTVAFYVPRSLAAALCEQLQIPEDKKNSELGKKDLIKMTETLKRLPLHLIGRAAGEEFVTAGGVDTTEVDPRSMESKRCPGLYFAGEILNIDGFTGGFNLQAAWATGALAGIGASSL